jgi:hypothetical protein
MRMPRSLQRRLGLSLGVLLTALWIGAASMTALITRHAMEEVFDSALQEAAQRILPLAVADILGREEEGVTQRLAEIREHDELLTYAVRDAQRSFFRGAVSDSLSPQLIAFTAKKRCRALSGSLLPSRWRIAWLWRVRSRWAWFCLC